MSFILDLIIAAIIGLTIYFAAKNGLVKTAISAVSLVLTIIITVTFASPLAETMKSTQIAETITEATETKITEIIKNGSHQISDLVEGKVEEFNQLSALAGIDTAELKNWYLENFASNQLESELAAKIAIPVIDTIAMLLAVIILYVGTQIVLSMVAFVLDKVAKLPILNSFNKLGGILIGVVLAFVRVILFCFAFDILIENAVFLDNSFINGLNPDNTLLFKMFHDINWFDFFVK